MKLRAIVTGTPRSGTKFIANLLCRLGINASHELYFNPWFQSIAELKHDVEVSWMAAPYLAELPHDTLIVHLVRNPLRAINSMISTGHFGTQNVYAEFLAKHSGTTHPAPAWYHWNRIIESHGAMKPYVRIRLEDWAALQGAYGVDRNTWGDVQDTVRVADLPAEVLDLARKYGYEQL